MSPGLGGVSAFLVLNNALIIYPSLIINRVMIWSNPLQVNSVLGPKTTWGFFKPGAWVASLCPKTAHCPVIQYLFLNHSSVVWSATSHCSSAAYSSQHESVRSICISIGLAWKTGAHASVNRSWTGPPLNQRFRGRAPCAAACHF